MSENHFFLYCKTLVFTDTDCLKVHAISFRIFSKNQGNIYRVQV